jgi:hypothetical protein
MKKLEWYYLIKKSKSILNLRKNTRKVIHSYLPLNKSYSFYLLLRCSAMNVIVLWNIE